MSPIPMTDATARYLEPYLQSRIALHRPTVDAGGYTVVHDAEDGYSQHPSVRD